MDIKLNRKYQPLFKQNKDIFFIFISGGRASAKSFTSSLFLALKLLNGGGNMLYCRQYMTSIPQTIIPQFMQKISFLNMRNRLRVYKNYIQNIYKGTQLWFQGLQQAQNSAEAKLKGIKKLQTVLIDQMQEVKEKNFDRLIGTVRDKDLNLKVVCCLNPTDVTSWIYKRFYSDIPQNFNGIVDNRLYIHTDYLDNIQHLSQQYIHQIQNIKASNPVKYRNQYLGMWLNNKNNAVFTTQMIAQAHKESQPIYLNRVVIGIDPAVSNNENSDQTGIIVAGQNQDLYYILQQHTGKYSPLQWAQLVNKIYLSYIQHNPIIVVENNQGGDLLQQNLYSVNSKLNIESIHAYKSKIQRAKPIAVLYQQKKVKHVKIFPKLQHQMTAYSGSKDQKSPNSLDAMVHALTYLSNTSGSLQSGF